MGHNNVVLSHPKFTGIPWVDGFVNGTPGFGASELSIRAQVNDYLGARVGGIHQFFRILLVIAEY